MLVRTYLFLVLLSVTMYTALFTAGEGKCAIESHSYRGV